jgi:hypothetical protein
MKKLKTVDIKGKEYVLVVDRIRYFNETYPNGCIETERLTTERGYEVVQATVTPDVANPNRYFQGLSQADFSQGAVNEKAGLENAETSAVGRALGMMGIGVIDSIASADEMTKVGISSKPAENFGVRHCDEHNVDVPILKAKSTGKLYAICRENGKTHFINSEEEISGFREKQEDFGQDNLF